MHPLHVPDPPKPDWAGSGPPLAAMLTLVVGVLLAIIGVVGPGPFNAASPMFIGGLALAGVGAVSLVFTGIAAHHRTVQKQRDTAARLGFVFQRPVTAQQSGEFMRGLAGLSWMSAKGKVTWYAAGSINGRPIAVCTHVTYSSDDSSTYLVAVTPAPGWPACHVQKGTRGTRAVHAVLSKMLTGRVLPPLEGFDPALLVTGSDAEAIKGLLTPAFQTSVALSPVSER